MSRRLRKDGIRVAVGTALLMSAVSAAFASSTDEVATLVDRWIGLRTTRAEEARAAREREAQAREEIDLLEDERAALEAELDQGRAARSEADAAAMAAASREDRLVRELRALDEVLAWALPRAAHLAHRVPPGLRDRVPRLPDPAADVRAAGQAHVERTEALVAFLAALETLQNGVHHTEETLEVNGVRRHADVLYLGLARGFAVSPAGDWAAVGAPGEDGWTWRTGAVTPATVRRALDVHAQRSTAELVTLPLGVTAGSRP